jgi:hypothetical protein
MANGFMIFSAVNLCIQNRRVNRTKVTSGMRREIEGKRKGTGLGIYLFP